MFGFRIQTLYVWLEILRVSMWSFLKKHNLLIFTKKWSLKHPPKWGKNSMHRLQLWFHIAPLTYNTDLKNPDHPILSQKSLQGSGNIIGCLVETCGVWRCRHFFCALEEYSRWWFQIFFMFTPTWGNDPIWRIFFRWVGSTTNQKMIEKVTWSKHLKDSSL